MKHIIARARFAVARKHRGSTIGFMGTTGTLHLLHWAPLGAALAYIFEEFVWPGNFTNWYRLRSAPLGVAYWIAVAALLASNDVWHLWATVKSHSYSPGLVTGAGFYVPLAIYGCFRFYECSAVSLVGVVMALLIGGSYPLWSAIFHGRKGASSQTANI